MGFWKKILDRKAAVKPAEQKKVSPDVGLWRITRMISTFLVMLILLIFCLEALVFGTGHFKFSIIKDEYKFVGMNYWHFHREYPHTDPHNVYVKIFRRHRRLAVVTSVANRKVASQLNIDSEADWPNCTIVFRGNWTTTLKSASLLNQHPDDKRRFIERVLIVGAYDEKQIEEMTCPPSVLIVDYEHGLMQMNDLLTVAPVSAKTDGERVNDTGIFIGDDYGLDKAADDPTIDISQPNTHWAPWAAAYHLAEKLQADGQPMVKTDDAPYCQNSELEN
ncbi:unnamed protein product, partial [Mesorhabditis spiculigera]